MTNGFRVLDSSSQNVFSSDDNGAAITEIIDLSSSSPTSSKTYIDLKGYTISFTQITIITGLSTASIHSVSTSVDAGGFPVLSWNKGGSVLPSTVLVLVD